LIDDLIQPSRRSQVNYVTILPNNLALYSTRDACTMRWKRSRNPKSW